MWGTQARSPVRVGLQFETVVVEPKTLLGADVSFFPSPRIDLPQTSALFGGAGDEKNPGFFGQCLFWPGARLKTLP